MGKRITHFTRFSISIAAAIVVLLFAALPLRTASAEPAQDFDGDGKEDLVLYNPTNAAFSIRSSSTGDVSERSVGVRGNTPVPLRVGNDGDLVAASFNRSTGEWAIGGESITTESLGTVRPGDFPVAANFFGNTCDDLALYNPRLATWTIRNCADTDETEQFSMGSVGSIPVVGDFDGDGVADPGTFRSGTWTYRPSTQRGERVEVVFGLSGDVPLVRNFDGQGGDDLVLFRPLQDGSTESLFIVRLAPFTGGDLVFPFGLPGDFAAVLDTIGNGNLSFVIFRAALGAFFVRSEVGDFPQIDGPGFVYRLASLPLVRALFVQGTTPNDFNRDRRSDLPIVQNASGFSLWNVLLLDGNLIRFLFGLSSDQAAVADVEGDLVKQPAVVRSSSGFLDWYLALSTGDALVVSQFGLAGDTPLFGDLDCDGKDDLIVSRAGAADRTWYWRLAALQFSGDFVGSTTFGLPSDAVFVADTNGDTCDELVVAQEQGGQLLWFEYAPQSGQVRQLAAFGLPGDTALHPIDFDGNGTADPVVVRSVSGSQLGFALTEAGAQTYALGAGTPCVGYFNGLTKADFATYQRGTITVFRADGAQQVITHPQAPGSGSPVGLYCGAPTSSACDETISFSDGSGGALYKPFSHGLAGHSVVLLPNRF
ncbi:MAG: hypothetical protein KDD69_09585, partial [Bdellovibrionales bacterium]|nr:hypothetical protein [Bdellovibrionales bacterium]